MLSLQGPLCTLVSCAIQKSFYKILVFIYEVVRRWNNSGVFMDFDEKWFFSSSSSEIYPKTSELLSLFLCICTHTASYMVIDGKTEAE